MKRYIKLLSFLTNKNAIAFYLLTHGIGKYISDKAFIKIRYLINFNERLDLDNPVTYNQKLQWLKLYDRNPKYINFVDKYAVKDYVKNIIGEKYIIPTLGVWNDYDDIDFTSLPNSFVLKCTHDSGGIVLCEDKSLLNKDATKKSINASIKRNYYFSGREWPYKNVKPRIIAEPYLKDSKTKELRDYKFFCFNGDVKSMFVATSRQTKGTEVKFDFFDCEYNHLPIEQGHKNSEVLPEKPVNFELMIELSKKISKGIPHVRVDFYEVDGMVFFGEMTLYHFSGFMPFKPELWDYTFGNWLELPKAGSET